MRKDKDYGNVPLWEACLCSASAPTYFPAHKLDRTVNTKALNASINSIYLIEAADAYIQQPKIQAALQEFLRISQQPTINES